MDQSSGGRGLRFRRICQTSGFSMCPPGMQKEDVNDPWMLCTKMQHSIGNAHGKVYLSGAEIRFGNDTRQLSYTASPFPFSLGDNIFLMLGLPAKAYCQDKRHTAKESTDNPHNYQYRSSSRPSFLDCSKQIQKVENMFLEL